MRLAAILCIAALACSGLPVPDSDGERPLDRLNPAGSPWGPPPDPSAEPEIVVTAWGVALVHTRGYSQVSLDEVEDAFYEAAEICEPEPGAFQVQIFIEPTLFKVDETWSAGATDGEKIWVVGHYEAWDGRVAHYTEMLRQELVKHLLECDEGEVGHRQSANPQLANPSDGI